MSLDPSNKNLDLLPLPSRSCSFQISAWPDHHLLFTITLYTTLLVMPSRSDYALQAFGQDTFNNIQNVWFFFFFFFFFNSLYPIYH